MLLDSSFLEREILKGVQFNIPFSSTVNNDLYENCHNFEKSDISEIGIVLYRLISGIEPFNNKEEIEIGFYPIEIKEETTEEFFDFLRCLMKHDDQKKLEIIQTHSFLVNSTIEMKRIKGKYPDLIYCSIYTDEVILDKEKLVEQKDLIKRKNLEFKFPSYVDGEYLDTLYYSQIIQIQEVLDIKDFSLTEISYN